MDVQGMFLYNKVMTLFQFCQDCLVTRSSLSHGNLDVSAYGKEYIYS